MKEALCLLCLVGFVTTGHADGGDVLLETNFGDIVIDLNYDAAPITHDNFIGYVEDGFYDGLVFHRAADDPAVIQAGAFDADLNYHAPTRAPIINESNNGLSNVQYTVAMARKTAPDSATSQFYINYGDNTFLDYVNPLNVGYCVFGEVISGMDVVDAIADTPTQGETPEDPVIIENATVIPEPATIVLLGLGCLVFVRKRRR